MGEGVKLDRRKSVAYFWEKWRQLEGEEGKREMTRMNKPPIPCHEGYRGIKTKETTRDKTRQDKTR